MCWDPPKPCSKNKHSSSIYQLLSIKDFFLLSLIVWRGAIAAVALKCIEDSLDLFGDLNLKWIEGGGGVTH